MAAPADGFEVSVQPRCAQPTREPLVFPSREHVAARLETTTAYWRRWAAQRTYDGRGATP